jgi:two-component system, chemotaxis family, chemotaxis protein CheY
MLDPRRVLVVDDDPEIRGFVADCLRDAGYIVDLARDGIEALQSARHTPPDVILLDLMMPGMDGWAFMDARRGEAAVAAPVAVMSAVLGIAGRSTDVGADAYVAKPFELDTLLRTVASLVDAA